MKLFCLLLGMLGLHCATANLLAPWVGPNVLVGSDPAELPAGDGLNQAEPHVTRSSVNPDLILATFQEGRFSVGGGAFANGYAVSLDGGFSWKRALNPNLTFISGGTYHRATDPVAGIANDGTLYLNSLVSVDPDFELGRLVVQRSNDYGTTWSDPVTIYTGRNQGTTNRIFPDKNWMTVNDIAGTSTEGRIIVTWTDFRTILVSGQDVIDYLIMSSYSDDRGESWSDPVFVTPPQSPFFSRYQYQGSQPVFLPEGDLAVVYHNFNGTRLEVRYSPDGGTTFPYPADSVHAGYLLYDAPDMRDGSFLPSVDVANQTGDIYLTYTSRDNSSDTFGHIYFVRSRRSSPAIPPGSVPLWNFSQPLKISGNFPARVTCMPTISVSPDGNRVTVFFYDNRNGTAPNGSGDFYGVQSNDGGASWTTPFRLSETTFELNRATETNRGYMLGDYFGMAAPMDHDQAAVAVWVGTPLATADPWSARISDTSLSVMQAWMQANLSHAMRASGGMDPYSDRDRDGVPLIMEYVTGQSPMAWEDQPVFHDGFSLRWIDPSTDPAINAEVSAGTGRWPAQWESGSFTLQASAAGEGYWNSLTWPDGGGIQQLRIRMDETEHWYLLDGGSPSRWVLGLEGGWVWSPWLGLLETSNDPWLYHPDLGWLYDLRGALYSPVLDTYLLASPRYHPWIYTSNGNFIYLYQGLPWIYDTLTNEWEGLDP